MSGVPSAYLAQEKCEEAAKAAIEFEEILGKGNYFLEIQEHGLEPQQRIRKNLVELSKRTACRLSPPTIALPDADDRGRSTFLLCIGPERRQRHEPSALCESDFTCVRREMWHIFGDELRKC
jgi:DNA polymerase-3 subunit alpha